MRRWMMMMMMGFLLILTQTAHAEEMQEIMVTGSRISGDDYSGMPAITLEKQADFLVISAYLTNDTRAADGRETELYQTIKDLLEATKANPGFALAYGDDFLIPITDANYKIPLTTDRERPDTSNVTLQVKVALQPDANVAEVVEKLRVFIKGAKITGRTEIKPGESVSLSIVSPEKYRYEIIKKIVDDVAQLRATVGPNCKVNISGLEGRVVWERTDVSELTLYIPHKVEVTECS